MFTAVSERRQKHRYVYSCFRASGKTRYVYYILPPICHRFVTGPKRYQIGSRHLWPLPLFGELLVLVPQMLLILVRSFVHSFVSRIHPRIHSFISLCIVFIHSFVHSFIQPFNHLMFSLHSFIHFISPIQPFISFISFLFIHSFHFTHSTHKLQLSSRADPPH